nr:amidohydrolase family protein [uncultured Methanocorpusculum sp.]
MDCAAYPGSLLERQSVITMTTIPNEKITAFTGGKIITMDPDRGHAETVIIQNGRIKDIGDAELVRQYPDAAVVDLSGRTLLPGFIDSHNHLSSFGCFSRNGQT